MNMRIGHCMRCLVGKLNGEHEDWLLFEVSGGKPGS